MSLFNKEVVLSRFPHVFTNGVYTIGIMFGECGLEYVIFHGDRYRTDYCGYEDPVHKKLVKYIYTNKRMLKHSFRHDKPKFWNLIRVAASTVKLEYNGKWR